MKALYITSIENFSGKTAICLAIGKRLQAEGYPRRIPETRQLRGGAMGWLCGG